MIDKEAPAKEWRWPIDVTLYDRRVVLTDDEFAGLDSLIRRRKANGQYERALKAVDRLLRPIYDALNIAKVKGERRLLAIRVLMRNMHRRRRAFWGWSFKEWTATLVPDRNYAPRYLRTIRANASIIAVAYLLCGFDEVDAFGPIRCFELCRRIFGPEEVELTMQRLSEVPIGMLKNVRPFLCKALLINRSPRLDDLTVEVLERLRQSEGSLTTPYGLAAFSRILVQLGIVSELLEPIYAFNPQPPESDEWLQTPGLLNGVPSEWAGWCLRWYKTTTLARRTRRHNYYRLLQVGRWLATAHPTVVRPGQWTRELAAEYVAVVDRSTIAQWSHTDQLPHLTIGKPLSPRSKSSLLGVVRGFFDDCHHWNWIRPQFDPRRYLATPRSITSLIRPNPRVIADDMWAKLLWAGLNLTTKDFCSNIRLHYPVKMIHAMVIVWLFAGLRSDEIRRLRVGCIRWQKQDVPVNLGADGVLPKDSVCWLDVPVNKTSPAFVKPVDLMVGEAISEWEKVRLEQPTAVDYKTGEVVHFLFSHCGLHVSKKYVNRSIIPLLCRKAGVPTKDARGNITSHRARSTIASLLFNAKEPMSLFELQEWLGHRSPNATQHYAKITPTKLAKSYTDAGYFERNIRAVRVLIDQEALRNQAIANGEPWKYYDLGHGYCTYDFFEQCPHRMACAKCSFYLPKTSAKGLLLEGRTNLLRMMQEIPLNDDERSAVEDGIAALGQLTEKLADVAAPDGQTPRQLVQITMKARASAA